MSETGADQIPAAQEIAAGYTTEGLSLQLGAVVVDGKTDPAAAVNLPLATLNRHGLVAGSTGSGKTKTLQLIAEQLSANGVPVVMADVKGDLSGLALPGKEGDKIAQRAEQTKDDWTATAFPTEFVSLGSSGAAVPVRGTVASFGPILLAKILGLNETQESSLGLIFRWAKDKNLDLVDLKDLRAVIGHLTSDAGKAELKALGGVSSASAGVILRAVANLEGDGGDVFFGEPEIDVNDLQRVAPDGRGVITLFELGDQSARPVLFSTFLMWVLSRLFQTLPEVGDVDKPKLVFILDEAHLLFTDASKAFVSQIEQTVKLIRSKGVSVILCTQLPTDIPNEILSQLGARVQHALRAFTPEDQKALARTAKTYPTSTVYDIPSALTSAGIGEAIVTVLSETGAPTPVAWTRLRAPRSFMGAIGADAIRGSAEHSALWSKYAQAQDRPSAYEALNPPPDPSAPGAAPQGEDSAPAAPKPARTEKAPRVEKEEPGFVEKVMENQAVKGFMRNLGSTLGREISKSLFGKRRR
jgi:DNA helicase HerA-like ATPase